MFGSRSAAGGIPGPPPAPVVGWRGNLLGFMRDPVAHLRRLHGEHGDIATLARGTTEYVFVFSPELNREVLGSPALFHNLDAASSPLRLPPGSALARLFTGLIQMNGDRHRQQRRLMLPALHHGRIQAYHGAIADTAERALAGWRPGQRRDVWDEMRALTLAVAVRTFIGVDPGRDGGDMCGLLERWMAGVFSLPAVFFPADLPFSPYRRLLRLSETLEREILALIARRRAGDGDAGDVLSMLLQAHDEDGARLTDAELVGQTNFLFMAGHATTAGVLAWTLLLLSQHRRVLGDVVDELRGVLRGGGAPSVDQLGALPLLDGVVRESMRLLPPVVWSGRVSTAAGELGGYALPSGSHVVWSAFVTHRRPELYPHPDRFVPERWAGHQPGPYAYLPFSAGPRMCLGTGFAMMEVKVVLALILQRFRLEPCAAVDPGGVMLLAPRGGLPMDVAARDGSIPRTALRGKIRTLVELD